MTVAFCDTETTGLHPTAHHVWEVGLILPDGEEHRWFLPVDLGGADPFALDIGQYHRRHPNGYAYEPPTTPASWDFDDHGLVPTKQFAHDFARLTFGVHLAGAVVSFDDRRLSDLLRREGHEPRWHYHVICCETLAAGWLAGYAAGLTEKAVGAADLPTATIRLCLDAASPPWDSSDLSKAVGVNSDDFEKHTALGDCRWAKAVYQAVLG